MLDTLVGANALQRPTAPRSTDADAEDRYYRSHEPRRLRFRGLTPLAAIVGLAVIVLGIVPH